VKAVTEYRDLSLLVSAVKVLFWANIAITVVSIWSGLQELELLTRVRDGRSFSEVEAESSDSRQVLLGGIYFVLWIVTFVTYLRWIYQSNRNARYLAGNSFRFTPGWAVGWHFVPIAGLWKPYQALRELFQASHPGFGTEWSRAPYPWVVAFWWILFILSSALGQILFRVSLRAETLDDVIESSRWVLVSDLVNIPLSLCGLVLVGTLASLQSAKRARTSLVAT
jgi:Domain of unknown function (DUF4328)